MRAIPNLTVIRPADANETAVAWCVAVESRDRPVVLVLTRQALERDRVLPPPVTARLAVELGVRQGWDRYVGTRGDMLSVDRFGASAPGAVLLRECGFTVENTCVRAKALLGARN